MVIDLFTRQVIKDEDIIAVEPKGFYESILERYKACGLDVKSLPIPKNYVKLDTYLGCVYKNFNKQKTGYSIPIAYDLSRLEEVLKLSTKSIVLGIKSDPFQWLDVKYGATKECLKVLKNLNKQVTINTCSDLVAHDDYIEILRGMNVTINMDLGTGDEVTERAKYAGRPSIKRRLAAIARLKQNGIKVVAKGSKVKAA